MTCLRPLALTALIALAVAAPSIAAACSSFGLEPVEPDTTLADDTPPGVIGDVDVSIGRGNAPKCVLGSCESSSCDDIGFITLDFAAPTDDQTTADRMAYVIEVVDGEPMAGLLPDGPFRPGTVNRIPLQWLDGATDDQEAFEFTIVIRAVDEAGNIGDASEPIEIADPGSASGCSIGGPGRAWPLLALLPLGIWVRRRTRAC
ncbi:MYXO-CTERM sorting domain-containing protein [Paraliomyxa miuraensis]|uniref:MYXO-CTERM sorting domain-containing protein n=1 Tax=Paraliomyxa miuraensis TaxID=376150 RepID=UPI0022556FC7|nr:MYXO-CTERM sorting domain-containing protein [Paraliomyxa miuraensis]MCX4247669.1 MYXO-CTERM sorting domain-containing protein [Paraliomyxa miuraensis]